MLKQAMAWMGLLMACGLAVAAPQGEQVVNGSASFDRSGDVTTITTSNNTIINYNSFNIAGHETVRFVQPNARSRVLNRIRGNDPTQIDGSLLSNGMVYIVNPAGVYFGNGSLVNVGGLYAAAGNVSNADFLSNINHFTDVSGNVVNRGTIDASLVAMVGRHVANYGSINVPNGMVTMVAGDDVIIAERDRSFSVRIEGIGSDAAGSDSETGVTNEGHIDATGGSVVWGAGDVYAMGIHNTGSVKARSLDVQADTTAHLGGTIDASNSAGDGGHVAATAKQLEVSGTIDASGATGGGTIKLGGDWQGSGDIEHAENTLITSSAHLIASAINDGAGGTIVIWSDGTTVFLGTAEAAGTDGYAGGSVETSGKYLHVMGGLVIAPNGQWLLDPFNVEAGDFGGAGNSTGGTFDGGAPNTWTPNASPSQVDVGDIETSLNAGTSVTITTAGGGAEPGNITVSAAINKTAGADAVLIFDADGNIDIQATIASTTGQLGVTLDSDGGDVTVDSTISTNGGDLTVQNAATYTGNAAVTTGGGAVAITTTGNQDYDDGAIDAGAGNVTLTTTAGGTINEISENQTPKITTTGTFTADVQAGGSIGDGVAAGFDSNTDPTGLFDVDAAILDLEVVGTGNINVMSHAAGGTQIDQAHTADGFPRVYTVGPMVLNDNAVLANDSPGAGFIWLISESTIDALNPGNLVATTGPSANARFDANGDIGTLANPLEVDTTGLFVLVDRGPFDDGAGGAGSAYINNQRAGQTNIVTMQLDSGDAVIQAPGDISIQDFSVDFDTSFNGAGDFTVTSTGGNIIGTSPITMGGGTTTLNSAGDIGTSANPLEITGFGGLALNANGGAGQIFLTDATFADISASLLANLDPTVIGVAPVLVITSTNTNIDIQSDGTDIDVNEFDVPAESLGATFAPSVTSVSGDINVNAGAIDIPLTSTDQQFEIIAQGGGVNLDTDAIGIGSGLIIIDAQNGAILQTGAGPHITHTADAGRVELTANTSIGALASPIEFAGTNEVVLDVNDDLFVQHDDTTDIDLLSVAVDPAGLPTFSFDGFLNESYNQTTTHTDANAIIAINDGAVDSLLLNNVRALDGAAAENGSTSYAFTAKTGHIYVDDNGAVAGGGLDGVGDGGIFSGNGDVSLTTNAGSILQESQRSDSNIRTNTVASTGLGANVGPLVTLEANLDRNNGVEGSIGDPTNNPNGFLDVSGAMRFVIHATDHYGIRGSGQTVELWDIRVDPAGPAIGTPLYEAANFDASFTHDLTSDGADLTVTQLESTHTFDTTRQGTRFALEAMTGNVMIGNVAGTGGIKTRLENYDPVRLPEEPFYGISELAVRVQSTEQSVLLYDNAIQVNSGDGATIGGGAGTVRLNAKNTIDELTDSTVVNISNSGKVHLFANNAGGAPEAIGNTVTTADTNEALDISAAALVAQAGQLLTGSTVHTAANAGGIFISESDDQADGLRLIDIDTSNGDIDIRSTGNVAIDSDDPTTTDVNDSARIENVTAGNVDRSAAGNGNVVIVAGGTITENTPAGGTATDLNIDAEGDQVALVAGGNVGGAGTALVDIEAAQLVGQVDGATGNFFVRDATEDLTINSFAVPGITPALVAGAAPGDPLPGITTFDGEMYVQADGHNAVGAAGTEGVLTVTGLIATDQATVNGSFVTLEGREIHFANLGVPGPATGGILDTDDIDLLADDGIFLDQAGLFTFRTATGTNGRVSFGEFALPPSPASTVDSGAGVTASLLVETDGAAGIFFANDVGATRRLGSVTTMSDTGSTFINGDIFTNGGTQTYFNDVVLTSDAHLDDTGVGRTAGIYFHNTVNSSSGAEGLSVTVERLSGNITSEPEVPLIGFGGDVGTATPLKWLRLNAYDADASGLFNDNAGDIFGRTDIPTVATIVVVTRNADGTIDTATQIDWDVFVFEDFTMGQNEKLTAYGSVDINANGSSTFAAGQNAVQLSDVNARGTLAVDANGANILLLNDGRTPVAANAGANPPVGILRPTDANNNNALDDYGPDSGLDFWGGSGISITNSTMSLADAADPAPKWYSISSANITGVNVGTKISHPYGFPEMFRTSPLGITVLDLIPLDVTFNLGTVFPPPSPELTDRIRIPLTRHEFMNEMFVDTRDAQAFELQRRAEGQTAFQDVIGILTQGGVHQAVLQRIREYVVPQVLDSYRATFFEASVDDAGETIYTPRYEQVRESLAAGVRAYTEGTGQAVRDPLLFRSFLEQTGEASEALATLNALRKLYVDMGQLGLTDREWSQVLYLIASKVAPEGLKPDVLNMAALGQPSTQR